MKRSSIPVKLHQFITIAGSLIIYGFVKNNVLGNSFLLKKRNKNYALRKLITLCKSQTSLTDK